MKFLLPIFFLWITLQFANVLGMCFLYPFSTLCLALCFYLVYKLHKTQNRAFSDVLEMESIFAKERSERVMLAGIGYGLSLIIGIAAHAAGLCN